MVRAWVAVVLWAALVWSFGSDGFSASQTSRLLGPLLDWLLPNASQEHRAELLFLLRKIAHVVEYGVLGVLALRAVRLGSRLSNAATVALCLLLVAGVAIADEVRQVRSTERSGSQWDVLLDLGGALAALSLVAALPRRWRAPLFPRPADGASPSNDPIGNDG